ncbi:S1 family peptidase, partial [Streptomyces sp. NPDC057654]|uniref:S1 family peptidase n=1 Tax=Streptomyces sp. NPDC057654 TaxID=3346196 RepID=UPI003676008A
MPVRRPRTARVTGLLASALAATLALTAAPLLTAAPAQAVAGETPEDGSYTFTATLDIGGGQRGCSATLVEEQWLLTAASCFADDAAHPDQVKAGAPKLHTTATIGRTDLTQQKPGTQVDVVELVPRQDRDLVMAKLATPVTGVTPAVVSVNRPLLPGEKVVVAGYGRTTSEWVPDRLHVAKTSVSEVKDTTVTLAGTDDHAIVCQGDTGGPAFREVGGTYQLIGIHSTSGQAGCLGVDKSEKRTAASEARVDDIAEWIQAVSSRTLLDRANWQNAAYLASGHFTSPAGGQRRMDLFVVWKDGSASLYQGADHTDLKQPFSAEHKIAKAGSFWTRARAVTGGTFAPDGMDGITVRWSNGKLSTYKHVDQNGVRDEQVLREPGGDNPFWKNARLITTGRYTDNPLRDDLLVLWDNGSVSMYTHTSAQGLKGWIQLHDAGKDAWTEAAQLSAGEFTGKKTDDLVIRWKDGDTTIFPGVDTNGFHGRTRIRDVGSPWKNA